VTFLKGPAFHGVWRPGFSIVGGSLLVALDIPLAVRFIASALLALCGGRNVGPSVLALGVLGAFTPWPLPAFGAWAIWALLSRSHSRGVRRHLSRRRTLVALTFGLVSGVVTIATVAPHWTGTELLLPAPYLRPGIIVLGVLVVAGFNSVGEELLWRRAWWSSNVALARPALMAIQTLSFSIAHLHGIPGGLTGMLLAGAFSLLISIMRWRWGFASAVVAHFSTDLVIFAGFAMFGLGVDGFVALS